MRILPAAREILGLLTICPWIPFDAVAVMSGARSRVSVYQILARLSAAGLVQKRHVRPGMSAGTRPTALWATTKAGFGKQPLARSTQASTQPLRVRGHIADPVRIAAARALAGWIATQRVSRKSLKVVGWEAPCVLHPSSLTTHRGRAPAAALVEITDDVEARLERIILVPDLATAPIASFRPTLLRHLGSLARIQADVDTYSVRLLVVTTNVDGAGDRRLAWLRVLGRVQIDMRASTLACDVLEWPHIHGLLGLDVPPHGGAGDRIGRGQSSRGRRADEMLDLVGRHPFVTIKQLATLLAVTPRRARQVRQSLVQQGLVRLITTSDLGSRWPVSLPGHRVALADDLAELTAAGRRHMARRLGLSVTAARHYHGLFGGPPRHRQRALRHLPHTVGANQVFVTLALMARHARARGADEALEEWRPAIACEHRRCKPDGYGSYRRGNQRVGFLLEYDRGTERARQYDGKLAGYHAYCRGGQAARDYAGLPHVLFVTTSNAAEARFIAAVERAAARHGDDGFTFLTTTVTRMEQSGPSTATIIERLFGNSGVRRRRRSPEVPPIED